VRETVPNGNDIFTNSPAVANGVVYAGGEGPSLYALRRLNRESAEDTDHRGTDLLFVGSCGQWKGIRGIVRQQIARLRPREMEAIAALLTRIDAN